MKREIRQATEIRASLMPFVTHRWIYNGTAARSRAVDVGSRVRVDDSGIESGYWLRIQVLHVHI